MRIGDYITVLRDGRSPARGMDGIDVPWIVRQMIGAASKDFAKADRPRFRRRDLPRPKISRCPAGAAACRRPRLLLAARRRDPRRLRPDGRRSHRNSSNASSAPAARVCRRHLHARRAMRERSVAGRIARGLALIPEDRQRDGLVPILSIRENMTLSSLARFAPLASSAASARAGAVARLRPRTDDQDRLART